MERQHCSLSKMSKTPPSSSDIGFFEGAEKLLEIWFKFPPQSSGLKKICRSSWESILQEVNCAILSHCQNPTMDAYLLSESSMFVTKERLILKTCGNTTLLLALPPLFECISKEIGLYEVMDLFYSRKDFLEPYLQNYPHCSFQEEVEFLQTFFPGGRSYSLGPRNNQWHLFVLRGIPFQGKPDKTFEMLMNNISSEARGLFLHKNYPSDQQMTECSGFHSIFPKAALDAKAFEPCGYSLNAVLEEDEYCNVHVTPQEECSYASFETNSSLIPYHTIVWHLVNVFQPRSFVITFFTTEEKEMLELPNISRLYEIAELNTRQLQGYSLQVVHYQIKCP